jgi:hypothetical protein
MEVLNAESEAATAAYRELVSQVAASKAPRPSSVRAVLFRAGRTTSQLRRDAERLARRFHAVAELDGVAPRNEELAAMQQSEREAWVRIEEAVVEARRLVDAAKESHAKFEAEVRSTAYAVQQIEEFARNELLATSELQWPNEARHLRETAQDLRERAEEFQLKANRLRAGVEESSGAKPGGASAEGEFDAQELDRDSLRLLTEANDAEQEAARLEQLPFDPIAGMAWETDEKE